MGHPELDIHYYLYSKAISGYPDTISSLELDFWLAASPAATGVMVPCSLFAEKLSND